MFPCKIAEQLKKLSKEKEKQIFKFMTEVTEGKGLKLSKNVSEIHKNIPTNYEEFLCKLLELEKLKFIIEKKILFYIEGLEQVKHIWHVLSD